MIFICLVQLIFKNRKTSFQCLAEPFLFLCQNSQNEILLSNDIWVGLTHGADCGLDERRHHQLFGAQ